MSCSRWQSVLNAGGFDGIESARRREFLEHLSGCSACRRRAAAEEPTILLTRLPAVEVSAEEVEEVRRTVRALCRVRELESTWVHLTQRGFAGAAMAALLLIALLLSPERPQTGVPERVPFADAVGMGTGLISLPAQAQTARFVIEIELAAGRETLFKEALQVAGGQRIERQLEGGYDLRFRLEDRVGGDTLVLRGFRVSKTGGAAQATLIERDLELGFEAPLWLELSKAEAGKASSYLRVGPVLLSSRGS